MVTISRSLQSPRIQPRQFFCFLLFLYFIYWFFSRQIQYERNKFENIHYQVILLYVLGMHVTPLAISTVFPFTEFCNQLPLGVFQIIKALFCQVLSKHTPSNSHTKFIALTYSFTLLYVYKYHLCFTHLQALFYFLKSHF